MLVLLFPLLRHCLPLNKIPNRSKNTDVRSLRPRLLRTSEVSIIDAYKDYGYDKLPVEGRFDVRINH